MLSHWRSFRTKTVLCAACLHSGVARIASMADRGAKQTSPPRSFLVVWYLRRNPPPAAVLGSAGSATTWTKTYRAPLYHPPSHGGNPSAGPAPRTKRPRTLWGCRGPVMDGRRECVCCAWPTLPRVTVQSACRFVCQFVCLCLPLCIWAKLKPCAVCGLHVVCVWLMQFATCVRCVACGHTQGHAQTQPRERPSKGLPPYAPTNLHNRELITTTVKRRRRRPPHLTGEIVGGSWIAKCSPSGVRGRSRHFAPHVRCNRRSSRARGGRSEIKAHHNMIRPKNDVAAVVDHHPPPSAEV